MGAFHRVDTDQVIRGAARILVAPIAQAKPLKIADVISLTPDSNETYTLGLGSASLGTFDVTVTVDGGTPATAAGIAYTASAATVQTALEALANIDVGDVTVTGGVALPTGPLTITFVGRHAATPVTVTVDVTGLTGATLALTNTLQGQSQFAPIGTWQDLGSTRDGIAITVNNSEDAFEVDQVPGEIGASPNAWEVSVATNFAEMTLEKFTFVWEGTAVTTDMVPTIPEREIGFAGATQYTERRIAILFKRKNGAILAFLIHKVVRSPQESTINFQKSGDPMTLAMTFRALADATEADPLAQFGRVREQVIT